MTESLDLNNFGENDVLSFNQTMLKVNRLKEEVKKLLEKSKLGEQLSSSLSSNNLYISIPYEGSGRSQRRLYNQWFDDGIACEILKVGNKGWQKGKVRINLNFSLEFCPDEPDVEETAASNYPENSQIESPLDDIRRMINQDS